VYKFDENAVKGFHKSPLNVKELLDDLKEVFDKHGINSIENLPGVTNLIGYGEEGKFSMLNSHIK